MSHLEVWSRHEPLLSSDTIWNLNRQPLPRNKIIIGGRTYPTWLGPSDQPKREKVLLISVAETQALPVLESLQNLFLRAVNQLNPNVAKTIYRLLLDRWPKDKTQPTEVS